MSRIYEDFMRNYGISNIQAVRNQSFMRRMDKYTSAQYYDTYREEVFDMDISRRGLERLIDLDKRCYDITTDDRKEAYLRNKHPALEEAYSKYQMLLALYR